MRQLYIKFTEKPLLFYTCVLYLNQYNRVMAHFVRRREWRRWEAILPPPPLPGSLTLGPKVKNDGGKRRDEDEFLLWLGVLHARKLFSFWFPWDFSTASHNYLFIPLHQIKNKEKSQKCGHSWTLRWTHGIGCQDFAVPISKYLPSQAFYQ